MSKYFESYSFEVPSTDRNTRKTKYSFSGPKEYIDSLKQKPVEITSTENYQGWLITSKGYANGVLSQKAEKMIGTKTVTIETITSNKLPKFRVIELESDYDPYNPVGDTSANYVEIYNKKSHIDPEFSKIDEQEEKPYERKYANSSIISISEFLRDPDFIKMLPKIGED